MPCAAYSNTKTPSQAKPRRDRGRDEGNGVSVRVSLNPQRPLSTATGEVSALAQCYPPRSQKDTDGIAQSGKSFSGLSRLSLPSVPASALGPFDVASRLPRKAGQIPLTTSSHLANRRSRIDRNRCSSFHLTQFPAAAKVQALLLKHAL